MVNNNGSLIRYVCENTYRGEVIFMRKKKAGAFLLAATVTMTSGFGALPVSAAVKTAAVRTGAEKEETGIILTGVKAMAAKTKKTAADTKDKDSKSSAKTKTDSKTDTKKTTTDTKTKDSTKTGKTDSKADTKKTATNSKTDTKKTTTNSKTDTKKNTTDSKTGNEVILNTKEYDFTGDGKNDTVKAVAIAADAGTAETPYTYTGVKVYLNGKLSIRLLNLQGYHIDAQIVKLTSKAFLALECHQENDFVSSSLYSWKNGDNGGITLCLTGDQMISTKDTKGDSVRDYGYGYVSSAKEDTLTFKTHVWSPTIGNYICEVPFTYTKGKLTRNGRTYAITSVFTSRKDGNLKAAKDITGYKKPEGKKSVKLKKGTLYRPDKVWIKGKKVYYHIPLTKEKVKAVWVKGITFDQYYQSLSGEKTALFKNIVLAG